MQRLLTAVGALGSGLLLAVACSDDKTENLFPDPDGGSLGGRTGGGGSGGSNGGTGGSGGSSGTGGNTGGSGGSGNTPGGSGGQDAGMQTGCQGALDCDDQNACTIESCADGVCVAAGFAASETLCGSATDDACTDPDTCDGAGVCQPNNTGAVGAPCGSDTDDCTDADTCDAQGTCQPNDAPLPNGTACTGGSCSQGQCVSGQPVGCPVDVANGVPFNTSWSSVGRPDLFTGGCDGAGTPDYALVFTAPQAGTFRFTAHALVDSTPYTGADMSDPITQPPDGDAVLTVAEGSCAGQAAPQLGCDDDVITGENIDSELDLVLTEQQVVTVYVNELTQTGGGTGTLSITLQP